MTGSDPLTELKGIGPAQAAKFANIGVSTISQLIDYYPRRYDDFSLITPIGKLHPGQVTVAATIMSATGRYVRRGMHITEAIAHDASGSVRLTWFNQPYRAAALKHGQAYYISGIFELRHQHLAISNPAVELVSDFPINTARIVPIYRETKGLTSKQIRQAIRMALPLIDRLLETLPKWLIREEKILSRSNAIRQMHFPDNQKDVESARHRLGFEEVFRLTLASLLNKQSNNRQHAPAVPFNEKVAKGFTEHMPFALTDSQRKVGWRIFLDMQKDQPMNRLVEGDVGSGKTVVAALAAVMVLHHGHQVAFMAPTELLARQHAITLVKLLEPIGYGSRVGLLVGSLSAAQKKMAQARVADGSVRLLVGTQALLQEKVDFSELELIIIDEQHRFGVEQRKTLMAKAGHMPHVLSLTATPIPRSLALTLYGELDVARLTEKPAGRLPIKTTIVSPNSRAQLYASIESELVNSRQAYIVCPTITDSSNSATSALASAEATYESIKKVFKKRRIGLMHGKLKPQEKTAVMERFLKREIDILVSTTVIEVGVDVPNASVMLIEDAKRFGLAQIHQLRGRVGRSKYQGYCYLMMSDSSAPSRRLRALEASNDGFKLADLDLELRGPGAIYGTSQHGELDLRIARLDDRALIIRARQAAEKFIETGEDLLEYKELALHVTRLRAVTNLN
jgi:ATP-dependent DNA helicase RecG